MISFHVPGRPRPQGSAKWVATKSGKAAMLPNHALSAWRGRCAALALEARGDCPMLTEPVHVELVFRLSRPRCHFGTGCNADRLKATAPTHPAGVPDVDKLARALLDSLSGTVIADDAQVVRLDACKLFCDGPDLEGVSVTVRPAEQPERPLLPSDGLLFAEVAR